MSVDEKHFRRARERFFRIPENCRQVHLIASRKSGSAVPNLFIPDHLLRAPESLTGDGYRLRPHILAWHRRTGPRRSAVALRTAERLNASFLVPAYAEFPSTDTDRARPGRWGKPRSGTPANRCGSAGQTPGARAPAVPAVSEPFRPAGSGYPAAAVPRSAAGAAAGAVVPHDPEHLRPRAADRPRPVRRAGPPPPARLPGRRSPRRPDRPSTAAPGSAEVCAVRSRRQPECRPPVAGTTTGRRMAGIRR
jgi:hypothetical protein